MTEPVYLLDSNICIYVLADAECEAARRLGESEPGSVVTSAIVYAEVMRGRSLDDARMLAGAQAFFRVVPVLPFDERAALRYRQIPFRRGTFDRLIAAHALSQGLMLITNNHRDYADVEGLRVEDWTRT